MESEPLHAEKGNTLKKQQFCPLTNSKTSILKTNEEGDHFNPYDTKRKQRITN